MKKIFKMAITVLCIVVCFLLIQKYFYKDYSLLDSEHKAKINLLYKGLEDATDFTFSEDDQFFIAYSDRIQCIDKNGKSYYCIKNKNLNITSIEYFNKNLYYASKSEVYRYNLLSGDITVIIKDIPNYGDYRNSKIKIEGNSLFLTIGASTNSGVVGNDNEWIKDNPYGHDISPKDITLKGINFGTEKTGAFMPYKTKNAKGQIIPGHFPGNSSVVVCNLKDLYIENYAWGLRNINGLDTNSEGKIIATVGGMENRGLRSVKGDKDYVFEIKKNNWYGWPDYSGGDPITSPRFKGINDKTIPFLLDNHPNTNPPAPMYQHKGEVGSLKSLAVDKYGILGEKDSIYFYEKTQNTIYSFSKNGILKQFLNIKSNFLITNIKFSKNELLALDNMGCIYNIKNESDIKNNKINNGIFYYLLITLTGIIIMIIVIKNRE